jgi:ribosomal protein L19E
MSNIGKGVTAVGGAYSAYTSLDQGAINASIAEREAKYATAVAKFNEKRHRRDTRKLIARQVAKVGKSGVQMKGSAINHIANTAGEAEIDALLIRHAGMVKAQKYKTEAALSRYKGAADATGKLFGTTRTLLEQSRSKAPTPKGKSLLEDEFFQTDIDSMERIG